MNKLPLLACALTALLTCSNANGQTLDPRVPSCKDFNQKKFRDNANKVSLEKGKFIVVRRADVQNRFLVRNNGPARNIFVFYQAEGALNHNMTLGKQGSCILTDPIKFLSFQSQDRDSKILILSID